MTSADAIVQHLFDATEEAVLAGDFAAFARVTTVPYTMANFECERTFSTEDELKEAFLTVTRALNSMGVSGLQRDIISAVFTSEDALKCAYMTRRFAGQMLVERAYPSIMTARCVDGVWKVDSSQHAVDGERFIPILDDGAAQEVFGAADMRRPLQAPGE